MKRVVFESLGAWRSAEDTANGRRRKKAMTMMSRREWQESGLYPDAPNDGGLLTGRSAVLKSEASGSARDRVGWQFLESQNTSFLLVALPKGTHL